MHIVTGDVSASCYPRSFDWKNGRCLTHAMEIDAYGEPIRVLCSGVKLDSILNDSAIFYDRDIDCPKCLRKLKPKTI